MRWLVLDRIDLLSIFEQHLEELDSVALCRQQLFPPWEKRAFRLVRQLLTESLLLAWPIAGWDSSWRGCPNIPFATKPIST